MGVVLGASLVPCSGAVTIFIFTMALGEYGVGFLAAFCMSMGMSLVIFGAASLRRGLKKGVERYTERAILLGECLGGSRDALFGSLTFGGDVETPVLTSAIESVSR